MAKYKVGDRVLIVPLSEHIYNWGADMNKYANTVMTIRSVLDDVGYRMVEDHSRWYWDERHHIVGLEDECCFLDINLDDIGELL